jgi:hypothetical protein
MSSQGHSETTNQAPPEEQSICVKCGFCCDGTLFLTAGLKPGERGGLPLKIEKKSYRDGDKEFFSLPCGYFSERCTIYSEKKAYVCSAYRCQLLKDLSDAKILFDDAVRVVEDARNMREEIIENYRIVTGTEAEVYFRKILRALGELQKQPSPEPQASMDISLLVARCNIFEALLIRHFRSADEFEKLVMK